MEKQVHKSDVCIVGAGPSGILASMFLAKEGIKCTLLEKEKYPRNKICGDGISGWVVTVLYDLDPEMLRRLNKKPFLLHSHGIRIVAPNLRSIDLPFLDSNPLSPEVPPGYICKRFDFDNFLFEEAKSKSEITVKEKTAVISFKRTSDGIFLETDSGDYYHAELVIFANGANSRFMKDPGGIIKTPKHTMTGLKAYFSGITGMHEQNYVELHFLDRLLPGYFWIFPLPNGEANVGVGIDQARIHKKKINLKREMFHAIDSIPQLKSRFKDARQLTKTEAYNLPLWDKQRTISGERFMLAGDAASLIDPVTGEGIGHAALSGMYAARQAIRSLKERNFSAAFMQGYDRELYDKIGKELIISSKIPRFIRYPWLFNMMVNRAAKSKILKDKLSKAMTDLEVRKKLKSPKLYLKVMLGK